MLLLVILVGIVQSSPQCTNVLIRLATEYQVNPMLAITEALPFIYLSGTGENTYGDYDYCLRQLHNYSTLHITQQAGSGITYGLCHSADCTTNDLNSKESQHIIKKFLIDSGIAAIFHIDFTKDVLVFYDPNGQKPAGVGTYITIFIMLIIIVISLIDPFAEMLHYFYYRKSRYQEYNRNNNINNIESGLDEIPPYESKGIIKDFSIIHNCQSLFNLQVQDPNLAIFNGLRSIAFLMVVLGHQFMLQSAYAYQMEVARKMRSWLMIWIFDTLYSVDMFFWIGGFFLGFVLFDSRKVAQCKQNPLAIIMVIFHRLLRIWPCYILVIMIDSYIAPYLGSGPRWFMNQSSLECNKPWRNLLFIDNLYSGFTQCLSWGWYLTVDFQLFLASLLVLIVYVHSQPKYGKLFIVFLLILTQCIGLGVIFDNEYLMPYKSLFDISNYRNYYTQPYCRGPPYFLGLLLGVLYREHKQAKNQYSMLGHFSKFGQSKSGKLLLQLGCYTFGFAILLYLAIGWHDIFISDDPEYWSQSTQLLYNSFCRLFWVIGLSYLVLANMIGIQDFFNQHIMNCLLFRFIAKISFTGYLIHFIIIAVIGTSFYQAPEFTYISTFQYYFGNLVIVIIGACLLSILVEIPFTKLEHKLMRRIGGRKNH